MFKRNEGILDRLVRVTMALVLLPTGLFLLGGLQGSIPGLIATGLGTLALLTGLTGSCPLYVPFGISTLQQEKEFMKNCVPSAAGSASGGHDAAACMCGPSARRAGGKAATAPSPDVSA